MAEYTYEDIIMDPEDPRLEGAIGKQCYLSDYPKNALDYARNNSTVDRLKSINKESACPFVGEHKASWAVVIIKKEEPKKYVPFESKEEFIEAFHYHDNDKYSETDDILLNYGMWLKSIEYDYGLVTRITDNAIKVGNRSLNWTYLLDHYTFLDGTPCGKEVEDE